MFQLIAQRSPEELQFLNFNPLRQTPEIINTTKFSPQSPNSGGSMGLEFICLPLTFQTTPTAIST